MVQKESKTKGKIGGSRLYKAEKNDRSTNCKF